MASPEVNPGSNNPDEPWKPPQRPGKLGVDYDDYGAEMAPNARVWRKYVEETDSMDKELVEGWNKTLDVILIFAALFSAISTAFVIESSKDLKPDYSERSSQTLLQMSQALSAIASGSAANTSTTTRAESGEFTPSSSAVAVNLLWFLSLSLSVAVSLIAILAKEWCYSFMAGRTGSMLKQARLRQQRWDGIERWKMKEILYVLPLLMHTALLLFAIGLSVFLWDINIRVALPVVITTSLAALFYVVTVSLPLFFRFCPYSTALVRFLYPYWLACIGNRHTKQLLVVLIASPSWIPYSWTHLKQLVLKRRASPDRETDVDLDDLEAVSDDQSDISQPFFSQKLKSAREVVDKWISDMRGMFLTDRSQLVEQKTPMDKVTSSMLSWMISNCEDSKSVDMALQALAGAERSLPRHSLWECEAVQLVCRRTKSCTEAIGFRTPDSRQWIHNTLLDEASLYSRSLHFLTAFDGGEGFELRRGACRWVQRGNHLQLNGPQTAAYDVSYCLMYRLHFILYSCWAGSVPRYELAAYEFNSVPIEADMDLWGTMERFRGQCSKQGELVQQITTGKVSNLPPTALVAMVNGITKTFLYEPGQSPIPLARLLKLASKQGQQRSALECAIAVGLSIAAFATGSYPGEEKYDEGSNRESNLKRAKLAYHELVARELNCFETNHLLHFGLYCLLSQITEPGSSIGISDVYMIREQLEALEFISAITAHKLISFIPASFNRNEHESRVASKLIRALARFREPDRNPGLDSLDLSCIELALFPSLCYQIKESNISLLTEIFGCTKSVKLKRLCLRLIPYDINNLYGTALKHLSETMFLKQNLALIEPANEEVGLAYNMTFLWTTCADLMPPLRYCSWGEPDARATAEAILRSLYNPFTVDLPEGSLPTDHDQLGFADLWLSRIATMCHGDPQVVLESNLLTGMLAFYRYGRRGSIKPRTSEIPAPFDSTWTWVQILENLQDECKKQVEQQAADGAPGLSAQQIDPGPVVHNASEDKRGDGICPEFYEVWT